MRYGFAVGRVKVRETKMLGTSRLDRLIGAADLSDQKRILAETDYGSFFTEANTPEDVEKALNEYLHSIYQFLEEVIPASKVLSYFKSRYDFQNLKVLLKEKCGNKNVQELWVGLGSLDLDTVRAIISNGNYDELGEPFASAVKEALERFKETEDYQQINLVMDKAFFKHLLDAAESTKNDFFVGYVARSIDLVNLKIFLRAKNLKKDAVFFESSISQGGLIDTGLLTALYNEPPEALVAQMKKYPYYKVVKESVLTTGLDLSLFDKRAEDLLIEYLRESKFMPVGLETLISYIIAEENEAKDLRMVLIGKLNGLPIQTIRERVRVQYV